MEEMPRERRSEADDEVSLVDLTFMFLKHRRAFYLVFFSALVLGVIYAFFVPHKYEYVTLVGLAEKEPGTFIEKPGTVIATLENRWLPEYQAIYQASHSQPLTFDINFVNPESTALIRMSSEASVEQSEEVRRAHGHLVNELEQSQSAAVSVVKGALESQIESLSQTVGMLESYNDAGEAIAGTVGKRLSLEATLKSIQPMEVLAESRKSSEPVGPARALIVVLAGMLGLMGGVFSAFFMEFASVMRARVSES
ncbi:Wzz/FepE/Etk N-terminal domain-containing protein [Marinobacter adhaerens]|uniref:Wzz/FepE/Etk N-terminal domain-containing protein n=1 Tax=Marinobacter adhaerens TaxID=1033846 RepID=UPI003D2D0CDC